MGHIHIDQVLTSNKWNSRSWMLDMVSNGCQHKLWSTNIKSPGFKLRPLKHHFWQWCVYLTKMLAWSIAWQSRDAKPSSWRHILDYRSNTLGNGDCLMHQLLGKHSIAHLNSSNQNPMSKSNYTIIIKYQTLKTRLQTNPLNPLPNTKL